MIADFCVWVSTYIASYLEDAADARAGINFDDGEKVLLGMAAASVLQNIVDRFYKLDAADREHVIEALKAGSFPDSFVQTFTRT